MKIVSYNVLRGFSKREHLAGASHWLQEIQPDMVALQELNGFSARDLSQAAQGWNHPHSILLKEDGFSTGLTSSEPITEVQRIREGYHHGLLVGRTHGLALIVVHLSPQKYLVRVEEAALICELIKEVSGTGAEVVVLGDFNSVSPLDQDYYTNNPAWLALIQNGERKNEQCRNLCDGNLDFSVQQKFLSVPLIDTVAHLRNSSGNESSDYTFPTSNIYLDSKPEFADARGRIDFIHVTPGLGKRLVTANVVNDGRLQSFSDHYPVVAEFRD